jgi:hypothetical protein
MNYAPNAYLLRQIALNSEGMPASSITLDTGDNPIEQKKIAAAARRLTHALMKCHGLNAEVDGETYRYEILTGATANRLDAQEDLLNDALNLLNDMDDLPLGGGRAIDKRVRAMIAEIETERRSLTGGRAVSPVRVEAPVGRDLLEKRNERNE